MQTKTTKGKSNFDEWVTKERVLTLLRHLALAGAAGLVSTAELIFGVRPFGIALAAAMPLTYLPAAFLGAAGGSLFLRDYLSLSALGILLVVRAFFSLVMEPGGKDHPFGERVGLRVVASAAAVLAVGVYTAVRGGYLYFDLFALLLSVAAAPLATFLYFGIAEGEEGRFPYSREAGFAALIFTAIFAVRGVNFAGLWPGAIAAALLAFLLAAGKGLTFGVIGAGLAGLCFAPKLAPAFLLAALCFSLLEKSSRSGGILVGAAVASGWGFLTEGMHGLSVLLPATLFAGALFLATDSTGLVEGSPSRRVALSRRRAAEQSAKALALTRGERRLREISGAFLDLSGTFYELCDRQRRPGLADLRRLCDRTFDKVCPDCPNRDVCWSAEYAVTAAAVAALGGRLHAKGEVDIREFPPEFSRRCTKLPSIISEINAGAVRLTEEAIRGDKTAVVAMDYAAMGRLLGETLDQTRESFSADTAMGQRIAERLSRLGFALESAAVCGKERRMVVLRGVRLPGEHMKIRELRRVLEQHCHFALGDPIIETAEGLADITFPEKAVLCSSTVKFTRPRAGNSGRHCGDSITTLQCDDGYDYVFLCDGMGSGNTAALTSTISCAFLSRMLRAGSGAENALKMLNGFLAARGRRENESSTTVDLLEIDHVSGEGRLYKCGAAPTLLLRGGEVTSFFSRTAPVGILESLDAERIRVELKPGDVLVQVSDGVSGGGERCPWLEKMLAEKWDGEAEKFARQVLGRAAAQSKDDLSVAVTELRAAPSSAGAPAA